MKKVLSTIILSCICIQVYSETIAINLQDIRLSARSDEYARYEFISFDSDDNGIDEIYEVSQLNQRYALQLWNKIQDQDLILSKPVFPDFNKAISTISIINEPFPIMSIMGHDENQSGEYNGVTILYGKHLSLRKSISFENIFQYGNRFDSFAIIDFNSIDDFNYVLTQDDKAYLFNSNDINQHLWTVNIDSPTNIPKNMIQRIKFNNDDSYDIIILEDHQITVRDSTDGGIIWSAEYGVSDVQIGNFDNDSAQEFVTKSCFGCSGELYQFDFSQHTPLWTFSLANFNNSVSDFKVYDKDSNSIDEIAVSTNQIDIIWLDNNGQNIQELTNPTFNQYSPIEIGKFNNNEVQIVTRIASYDLNLTQINDTYERYTDTFKNFMVADLHQSGEEQLLNINKKQPVSHHSNNLLESLNSLTGNINWMIEFEDLSYGYDINEKMAFAQMDDDASLEIITSSGGFNNGYTINTYDGITNNLEKTFEFEHSTIVNPFKYIPADKDGDGLSELYIFSMVDYNHYQIFEVNNDFTEITWTSPIYQGNSTLGEFIVENIDLDSQDEIIMDWDGDIVIFDVGLKAVQKLITTPSYVYTYNLQEKVGGYNLITLDNNQVSLFDTVSGLPIEQFSFGEEKIYYAENIFLDHYLLIDRSRVYVYNIALQNIVSQSNHISSSQQGWPKIIKSKTNIDKYYIGNDFGFWNLQLNEDLIFNNNFE